MFRQDPQSILMVSPPTKIGHFEPPDARVQKLRQVDSFLEFRILYDQTQVDAYPVPQIDQTIDAICGSKWFLTLHMSSRYLQVKEIKYFGFLLNEDGIVTHPVKTESVAQSPTQKSKKSFSPFWKISKNLYVNLHARIQYSILTRITKKFLKISNASYAPLIFLIIRTLKNSYSGYRASGYCIGVVFSQIGEFDETERVIQFASRPFSQTDRKYLFTKLESVQPSIKREHKATWQILSRTSGNFHLYEEECSMSTPAGGVEYRRRLDRN
ncbi:hypothetical protein RF11_12648 [Thelohanellus kitauei]|uniref:Uncharacterized protein n=1 Tax=Thelohanellus kitauei TaxID=669202 RepID=A0A0C2J8V2_THEKT|nr:hypothetical protein RF11_12648 [Thelohanellus kitauei]